MDMELRVTGRGKLTARVLAYRDGLVLRLDDDQDLAFWAEVELTADQLRALLRQARAAEGANHPGEEG
jgi:hypothetical protein